MCMQTSNSMVHYMARQHKLSQKSLLNYWNISKEETCLHNKFYQHIMYVKAPDLLELEESPLALAQHYTVIPPLPNIQEFRLDLCRIGTENSVVGCGKIPENYADIALLLQRFVAHILSWTVRGNQKLYKLINSKTT